MKQINIFCASSITFSEERNLIGDVIRNLQDEWIDKDVRIHLFLCEFADHFLSLKRKQDEYNEQLKHTDIFIMLVKDKIGKYTLEEFEEARKCQVPYIHVFFKHEIIEQFSKEYHSKEIFIHVYEENETLKMMLENILEERLNEL